MIKKALSKDAKLFAKTKQIRGKRPSEYWLLFFKHHVLTYKKPWFHLFYFLFFIPIAVVIFFFVYFIKNNKNLDNILPIFFVCTIISFIAFGFFKSKQKQAIIPLEAFQELAKFIISIKGDVHKNLINLSLNFGAIEDNANKLNPDDIGLPSLRGVKYIPYEIARFKSNFTLKDGSICFVTMNQIALQVITRKRRSSGKTKTKMKRKHKFFYQLTLKLNKLDYKIVSQEHLYTLLNKNSNFNVAVKEEDKYCWVKVKTKKKLQFVTETINTNSKHTDSIFNNMMQYLINTQVIQKREVSESIKKLQ